MNEHSSVTFLKSLYQHCDSGFINLRFLPSAKHLFIPLSKIDSFPSILEANKDENADFAVATRVVGDGSKTGILQIPALWVDVDMESLAEEKKNEIRQRCQDFSLKPSFLLNTGGGIHIYWLLKVPASKEEISQVENLLKRLAYFFGGDMGSTDASRILRIPKTLNYKYIPPREVALMVLKPKREYDLSDFDFLPQVENIPNGEEKHLSLGWEKELLEGVSEGERNNAITRLVGRYIGKGLSRDEILPILVDVNSRFKPPLPLKEIEAVLESVIKTDQRNHPNSPPKKREEPQRIRYHLTTLDDVFEYPEPTFIIDQILVEGTVSVLGAYTGVGKSMTALSIIKSILTGGLLWGKYSVLKTGSVLLVDEETPKGFLRERVKKMGFDKKLPLRFLHFQDVRVDNDDCFNALMARVEEIKPILVVIDSLIRVHRHKEGDNTEMSRVIDRLRKIANWGTTILVIHHHGKGQDRPMTERLRGASDIPAGVDIEYALIPKDDYLIFSSVKTRTKPLPPIRLKMEVSETSIEMLYAGTEAEEMLTEVKDVLNNKGRLGVSEIWEELKARDYEIGINRLRDVLKGAVGKEIQGEKEKGRGKRWVYWVEDSSRFTDIYKGVKSEGTNQDSEDSPLKGKREENSREETTQYFQTDHDSSRVKKQGVGEELKDKDGYEVMDDGQITY